MDGLFLAAFQSPADAILWALECNEKMIRQVCIEKERERERDGDIGTDGMIG